FEIPLRPKLWFSYSVSRGPVSPRQQQPNPHGRRKSNVSGDFLVDDHASGRKKSVRRQKNVADDPAGDFMDDDSVRGKKSRSAQPFSKQKNGAADMSRRLTDYFPTRKTWRSGSSLLVKVQLQEEPGTSDPQV
ncbi:hypothetical protein BAE44_0006556, partial [Dichanthelium oligosanthes]